MGRLIVVLKELSCRPQQGFYRGEKFVVSHLPSEMAPQHLNGVQPRTVGRQVEQDQAPGRPSYDPFDFIILMGVGIVPGDVDGSRRMLVHQRLQQFGNLSSPLVALHQDDRFSRMIIDRADPVMPGGLSR